MHGALRPCRKLWRRAWRHKRTCQCLWRLDMQRLAERSTRASTDFLPLKGTDYFEFYVGNARQAAYYYRAAFGMQLVAYSGPETGQRGRASYVVQQNKIRLVLTTPLQPDGPISRHI